MLRRPIESTQFTSDAFVSVLHRHAIQISMDGCGCWRDNVFVERLWRSVKYEDVYLRAYETVAAVRAGLKRHSTCVNHRRRTRGPHAGSRVRDCTAEPVGRDHPRPST